MTELQKIIKEVFTEFEYDDEHFITTPYIEKLEKLLLEKVGQLGSLVMPKIAKALKEIVWMARRYADGRETFSPTSFNDAYDTLRDIFGKDIEYNDIDKWVDHTLTENGKYFPYAQDGGDRKHFDAVKGRKYSNFSE